MKKIITGLDSLLKNKQHQDKIKGNIAYLCHSASVDYNLDLGIIGLKKIFGDRLKKIFGPQHGLVSDVQDNMIETDHFTHDYFNLPVYSLYSETRIPTDSMLDGIDTFIIDLQDVGTRVYTYIATMTNILIKCDNKNIKVVILDRPNPIGGEVIEGAVLQDDFTSFVGPLKIPQRHALTMGEVALFAKTEKSLDIEIEVIQMENWLRVDTVFNTATTWINPSPNLSTPDSAFVFVGTVLFEGTNISEGRGTTRALECIGHPKFKNYQMLEHFESALKEYDLQGQKLRPISFHPMFQKHAGLTCQGFQVHVTDHKIFRPWKVAQVLCKEFFHNLQENFSWNSQSYEYENDRLSIDLINGTDSVRQWVENNGSASELIALESIGLSEYLKQREKILLY